jgi:Flp pilus assembly protein CpaB
MARGWHQAGLLLVLAVGLLGVACSGAADDSRSAQKVTTAVSTPLELGEALRATAIGCDDLAQSALPSGVLERDDGTQPEVESAVCSVSGERTVLNVQGTEAAQRAYLESAPEILCSMAVPMGRSEAVTVTGDWWSARPESLETANLIAGALGGDVHVWAC